MWSASEMEDNEESEESQRKWENWGKIVQKILEKIRCRVCAAPLQVREKSEKILKKIGSKFFKMMEK